MLIILLCYYDDLVPDDAPLSQVILETELFSLSIRSSRHLKRLTCGAAPLDAKQFTVQWGSTIFRLRLLRRVCVLIPRFYPKKTPDGTIKLHPLGIINCCKCQNGMGETQGSLQRRPDGD